MAKEQIVNLERFGAALLVTSECTLAAGQGKPPVLAERGHVAIPIKALWSRFLENSQELWDGCFWSQVPGNKFWWMVREGKSGKEHAMISDCLLAVGDIT